ncbi:hypothetical protein [Pedobacter sp.]
MSQLIADLYALPPARLAAQATAVKTDFKKFVTDNFTLTNDQKVYLNGLNGQVAQYFGDQCWFCFLYQLNITLVYPDSPSPAYAKYVESKSTAKLTTGLVGDPTATGELTFTMIYKLP